MRKGGRERNDGIVKYTCMVSLVWNSWISVHSGVRLGSPRGPAGKMETREGSMKKSQAEAKVEEINSKGPQWFCPLIQDTCNPQCINFSKAYAYNENDKSLRDIKQDDYQVYHQFCSNAMFMETMICPGGMSDE